MVLRHLAYRLRGDLDCIADCGREKEMNEYLDQLKAERKQLNQEWAYLTGSKDAYAIRQISQIRRELAIIGEDIRLANENATTGIVTLSTFNLDQLADAIVSNIRSAK